jgi:hypothetical protein
MRPILWTSERIEELRRLRASGSSNTEIAAALDTTKNAVVRIMHRYKIRGRPLTGDPRQHRRHWDDETKQRFAAAWGAGMSVFDMGRQFGVHYAGVSHRAAALGLAPRLIQKDWRAEDDARLRALWKDRRLTRAHIAKMLGTTADAVSHRVRALDLPRRQAFLGHRPWTRRDNKKLRKLWFTELSPAQIALRLRRTKSAVIQRRPLLCLPPRGSSTQRVSLAVFEQMSEGEKQRLSPWRKPVMSAHEITPRLSPKKWGVKTF